MLHLALPLFLAGMLTIFLPCILPLVPVVLGVSAAGTHRLRPLVTIVGLITGFVIFTFLLQVVLSEFVLLADVIRIATYYVLFLFGLGFVFHAHRANVAGAVVGSSFFLGQGWQMVILAGISGIAAVLVGSRVAGRLQQLGADMQYRTSAKLGAQSLLTAFIIGLTMGLVWVPCAGPALGFALALVREQPGPVALLSLALYAAGAGVPLLLIGYGGQTAVRSVHFFSRFSGNIKRGVGIVLILSAVAFRLNLFRDLQTWLVTHTAYGTFGTTLEEQLTAPFRDFSFP